MEWNRADEILRKKTGLSAEQVNVNILSWWHKSTETNREEEGAMVCAQS